MTVHSKYKQHNQIHWLGLGILFIAAFMTIFDLFVVNVAIPDIRQNLHAGLVQSGYVIAGYELSFASFLILAGRLGDRYGRRRIFVWGMWLFVVSSLFCGLAPGIWILISARMIQGISSALLLPQVYSSIRINIADTKRAQVFSVLGTVLGLAAVAGQVLGGWLIHLNIYSLSWRIIFLINIPVGVLAISFAKQIPESIASEKLTLDIRGVILFSIGLSLLLLAVMEGASLHGSVWIMISIVTGITLLSLFVIHQKHLRLAGKDPLIDFSLFRDSWIMTGMVLVFLIYSTSASFFLSYSLFVQTGLGVDAFLSGMIFAPTSVAFIMGSLIAPRLVSRWGTGAMAVMALLYLFGFSWLGGQIYFRGEQFQANELIPALVVTGLAQGMLMTPLLNMILNFVSHQNAGMASGMLSTLQQIGAAVGVAVISIIWSGEENGRINTVLQRNYYAERFVNAMVYELLTMLLVILLLLWLRRR